MIRLIFKNNKATGYATVGYSSSDTEEIVIEKSEQELNDLLSPILEEGETWKDKYSYLELDENDDLFVNEKRYLSDKE